MKEQTPQREITLELNSVKGVNKDNFKAIVSKLEELFAQDVQGAVGDLMDISIWPDGQSPDEQYKQLENQDEMQLFFLKVRK